MMFVCASFSIATTWNGLPCSCEPLPTLFTAEQSFIYQGTTLFIFYSKPLHWSQSGANGLLHCRLELQSPAFRKKPWRSEGLSRSDRVKTFLIACVSALSFCHFTPSCVVGSTLANSASSVNQTAECGMYIPFHSKMGTTLLTWERLYFRSTHV